MRSKRASIRFIENIYKLYEQKMYQVAYSVLHDPGLAEDAVQEAFIKLMKHIPVQDYEDGINDIKELISSLPEKYYLVVNCLAIRNLSVKETALELGITEANVRKRVERAKLMLKNLVKGSGGYETGSKLHKPEAV